MTDVAKRSFETAFESFEEFIQENHSVLELCVQSIRQMEGIERLTRVLKKAEKDVEAAKKLEALATREKEGGFQLLLRHASVLM